MTTPSYFPQGFSGAGARCGIKQNAEALDLTLLVSDRPATGAGVYTQNRVRAAAVEWNSARTPDSGFRAIVINSGNANACTGEEGNRNTVRMAVQTGEALDADSQQVLVLSTGIIGEQLPIERIEQGIAELAPQLGVEKSHAESSARGMMTTDTRPKYQQRCVKLGGSDVRLLGFAKGAAMIGPNMATMLAAVLTDAQLTPKQAQQMLKSAVDKSFNCISVEGHMSTNDTVLLVANGAAEHAPLTAEETQLLQQNLDELCQELAQAIVADGEGAQRFLEITVTGCGSVQDADLIARTVANSPLVKTAMTGADPNWGRIVSAAGYAGVDFAPDELSLVLNGTPLYSKGTPVPFDETAVSESIQNEPRTCIDIKLASGDAAAQHWTCDITTEYIHLNADYHT